MIESGRGCIPRPHCVFSFLQGGLPPVPSSKRLLLHPPDRGEGRPAGQPMGRHQRPLPAVPVLRTVQQNTQDLRQGARGNTNIITPFLHFSRELSFKDLQLQECFQNLAVNFVYCVFQVAECLKHSCDLCYG